MKQPQKQPPTGAQLAVWHGVQSALQAGFISVCVAGGQYLVTGNINANTFLTVLLGAFAGAGSMVYKSVSSNPALAQAALDTAQEAIAKVEQLAPWLAQDIQKIQQQKPVVPLKPILMSPPAQQSGGGGMPPDYYTRYQRPFVEPSQVPTQRYPSIDPAQSLNTINLNQSPPAMSFLQENNPRTQQGG